MQYVSTFPVLFFRMNFDQGCQKQVLPQGHVFGGSRQHRIQLARHQGLPGIQYNLSCNCENIMSLKYQKYFTRNKDFLPMQMDFEILDKSILKFLQKNSIILDKKDFEISDNKYVKMSMTAGSIFFCIGRQVRICNGSHKGAKNNTEKVGKRQGR